MKVCILSETGVWGGAEVHTVGLARALASRGHEVLIVALNQDLFSARLGDAETRIRVRRPALARRVRHMGYAECAALVRELPGDACVLVRWGMEAGSLRLDVAARRRFGRYIAVEHSCAEMPPRTHRRWLFGLVRGLGVWWYAFWLLWHLRSAAASRVVCVSEAARGRMLRQYRLPRRKVLAVPNGIDVEKFRPHEARRAAARRAWGVSDGTVVLGALSRLSEEKGLDRAIKLFGLLRAKRPERDLRLVLLGDGSEEAALRKAAGAAGVEDRLLMPGFCERPWEAYCGFDVHLLPSRVEALPLALLEAMACGCPSVAMGVGGVPEVLRGAGAGWLVGPDDLDGFLAGMDEATGLTPERRRELGRAARERVVSRFNAGVQYEALARVIEQG